MAQLRGIGVAGHMHGATLLDKAGRYYDPAYCGMTPDRNYTATQLDQTPASVICQGILSLQGSLRQSWNRVREHELDVYARIANRFVASCLFELLPDR